MFKRLFFAIRVPKEIKEELIFHKEELISKIDRGVKWVEDENLHITLGFLGQVKEELLDKVIKKAERIEDDSFIITLKNISYFPNDKTKAKIIWATGESLCFEKLEQKLKNVLLPEFKFLKDNDFNLHITLGRIKQWDFRKIPLYKIPEINESLNLNFEVLSFDLMESILKKTGPEYFLVKSFNLRNEKK